MYYPWSSGPIPYRLILDTQGQGWLFKQYTVIQTISTAIIVNMWRSLTKEWDCCKNATSPTHHNTRLLLISLDCGLQSTLMVNSMHWHHNQSSSKSSDAIPRKFKHTWLAHYSRLAQVVHDNGGKFMGYAFAHLLCVLWIKDVTTTNKNPHSNAICKCKYQTMAIMLKTLLLSQPPQTPQMPCIL